MDEEPIECGICLEPTVLEDLKCCAGSICKSCLDTIINSADYPLCPFCRTDIVHEDHDRQVSEIKVAKSDPTIKGWLIKQSRATPGVPIRLALQIRRVLMTYRRGYEEENPPNFDYLYVGYYYTCQDLWDDFDKITEYNRLREFTTQLDNYRPFFNLLGGKANSTRLFPEVQVSYSPPKRTIYSSSKHSFVTKPKYKPLPPSLPSMRRSQVSSSASNESGPSSLTTRPKRLPPARKSSLSKAKEKEEESDEDEEL